MVNLIQGGIFIARKARQSAGNTGTGSTGSSLIEAELATPLLSGSHNKLLAIKVSDSHFDALMEWAGQHGKTLPEAVRSLLWFSVFPAALKRLLQRNDDIKPNEVIAGGVGLEGYRYQLQKVLEFCDTVRQIEAQALQLEAEFQALELEAEKKWNGFVTSSIQIQDSGTSKNEPSSHELSTHREGDAGRSQKGRQ